MGSKRIKNTFLVLTLTLAFSEYLGDSATRISDSITYGCLLFWIVLAVGKLAFTSSKIYSEKNIISLVYFKDNFTIRVIIYLYTLFLIFTGLTESRFFSTNLQTFINGCSAVAVIYLFGKEALKLSVQAFAIAYGIAIMISIIRQTFFFEFHDMAYASGFLIIYYIFQQNKITIKQFFFLMVALVIAFLAAKRIGMLGLLVVLLIHLLLKTTKSSNKLKVLKISIIVTCIVVTLFLFLVSSGLFWSLASFGENDFTAGRSYYYQVFYDLTEFTPTFLGLGRNAMQVIFVEDFPYFHIANIHSDILRMYAECGFVLFFLWMYCFLFKLPRKIEKVFGYHALEGYVLCTIYLFITYMTDNTELYKVTQYFYVLVCAFMAFDSIKKNSITLDELVYRYKKCRKHIHLRLRR